MQQEILLPTDTVPVTACPRPFTTEHRFAELPAGLSISEMIAELQPEPYLRCFAHVFIGGVYVQPEYWAQVRPKAGAMVSIRMVPQDGGGGGGKSPLRTILLIAVLIVATVVSFGALAPVAAGIGLSGAAFAAGKFSDGVLLGGELVMARIDANCITIGKRWKYSNVGA